MILFPKRHRVYWYVTDIWETFVPVPVQVERFKGDLLVIRITVRFDRMRNDEYTYEAARNDLYRRKKQAARVASMMNKRR